jgi:hypothetical protein
MDDKTICGFFSDLNVTTRACARHFRARMVLLMALLAVSSTGIAQQLIVNGDFDSDLSGWNVSVAPGTTWSPFDYAGASSGSALFTNDVSTADTSITHLTQCVVLAKPGRYDVFANGYLPAGQSSGKLYVDTILYLGTECQGPGGGPGFFLPATIGAWSQGNTSIDVDALDVLSGVSIQVRVGIHKTPAGGSIQGYLDAVRVIYDSVFVDGFEPPLVGN